MPPFSPYLNTRWKREVYVPSLSLKPRDRTPLLNLKGTEWAPEPGFEHKTVQSLARSPTLCTHYVIRSIPKRPHQFASLHSPWLQQNKSGCSCCAHAHRLNWSLGNRYVYVQWACIAFINWIQSHILAQRYKIRLYSGVYGLWKGPCVMGMQEDNFS
jgi:hypothetical protein